MGSTVLAAAMDELVARLAEVDPGKFPYAEVLKEFRRVGKHFVSKELLGALDAVRRRLAGRPTTQDRLLGRFLDCALDKWDGRYDYSTYVGLTLLPLPDGGDPWRALVRRDRLHLLLVTDALRFEIAAADGRTDALPRLRPTGRMLTKRCRLGNRAVGRELGHFHVADVEVATDPIGVSRQLCEAVMASASRDELRYLELSMLPVYVVHDEYLFIRVLQAFEATFALMAVQLSAVVRALAAGDGRGAVDALKAAETALRGAAPLFALLATMQVPAFRTFRQFTEGASAIQSENYKILEAFCRKPDPQRLESAAYGSVPEIRRRVMDGISNIDETLLAARASGRLTKPAGDEVATAMADFEAAIKLWRRTHHRLAVRMLGDRPGTGYTEGTRYLEHAIDVPVFLATGESEGRR
ncbi:hypothetical protein ACFYTC_26685 [Actinomadura nitritigenes]|uniref:hypothetical protein n=1 Tax=Actinomadura nitritigenes TaxID=134602 RepID=UPI00369CAC16